MHGPTTKAPGGGHVPLGGVFPHGVPPADAAYLVCGPDNRITAVSPALAAGLGFSPAELAGRRAIDLVLPVHRPRALASVDAVLRRGEPAAVASIAFTGRDGSAHPALVVLTAAAPAANPLLRRAADARPGLIVTVLPAGLDGGVAGAPAAEQHPGTDAFAAIAPDLFHVLQTVMSTVGGLLVDAHAAIALVLARLGGPAPGTRYGPYGPGPGGSPYGPYGPGPGPGGSPYGPGTPYSPPGWGAVPAVPPYGAGPAAPFGGPHHVAAGNAWPVAGQQPPYPPPNAPGYAAEQSWSPEAGGPGARGAGPYRSAPAEPDSLTGLATRSRLVQELEELVAAEADLAVLLVDLDEFKEVNDLHGHEVGDEVLVHIAQRLRLCVRPDDLVVRFGGDEFVILCQGSGAATTIAERVVSLLGAPIGTTAGAVSVTASVGIADRTIPIQAAADLLSRADTAMYSAKRAGKNQYFRYDDELHGRVAEDKATERLLRKAVLDRRIRVHYQPIMAANGVDVVGVEAVARLVDDDGQVRMPADFLPIAERTGLVGAIDAWVLTESCRCIGEVGRNLGQSLAVSVNVSAQFVARADLTDVVLGSLRSAGHPASALMLEISEEVMSGLSAASMAALQELRRLGVRVALDHFGADRAQLSALRRLPLSHIKVDRPSIARMLGDDRDAAVVEAVTWLVDRLGLTWIAEGVETDEQWRAVQRFGPGLAQGFLFAAPLPEDELRTALSSGGIGGPGFQSASREPHLLLA